MEGNCELDIWIFGFSSLQYTAIWLESKKSHFSNSCQGTQSMWQEEERGSLSDTKLEVNNISYFYLCYMDEWRKA